MAKQKDPEHKGIIAKAVDAIDHALNPEAPVPNAESHTITPAEMPSHKTTEAVEAKVKASEPCPGDYVDRKLEVKTTILGDQKHDQ